MPAHAHESVRRGAALVLVLFAIAFLSVLALAMLDQATLDLQILRNHRGGLQALYAADAGVADAIAALRGKYDTSNPVSGSLAMPGGGAAAYAATIENPKPVATIRATGQAAGFTRKVICRVVVGQPDASAAPYPVRVVWWREATAADGF